MDKTLNEKLILLYGLREKLDGEIEEQVVKMRQGVIGYDESLIRELATRRNAVLTAIGKIKSEADTNFLNFMYERMNDRPNASVYKKLRELLDIKNKTNNKDRLVIIDDTICVNEDEKEQAASLLASLNAPRKKAQSKARKELEEQEVLDLSASVSVPEETLDLTETEMADSEYVYKMDTNKALIANLEAYINNIASDLEKQNIRKAIRLLKTKSRNLVKVCDIGYVSLRSAGIFENLISGYLASKIEQSPIDELVLDNNSNLNTGVVPENLYDDFLDSNSKKAYFSSLAQSIMPKQEQKPILALPSGEKRLEVSPVQTESIKPINLGLQREALAAIQSFFAKREQKLALQREAVTKVLPKMLALPAGKPILALPAPKKRVIESAKIEQIVTDALQSSGGVREQAINEALNTILNMTDRNDEVSSIINEAKGYTVQDVDTSFVPPKRYDPSKYKTDEDIINEKMKKLDFSSEANLNISIKQLVSEITGGRSDELEDILNEIKTLLKDTKNIKTNNQRETQIAISSPVNTKPVLKKEPLRFRIRNWSAKKFKDIKIFCDSLIAVSLADSYMLGENPYVSRLTTIFNTISDRFKRALQESDGTNKHMDGLYKPINFASELAVLKPVIKDPNIKVSEYDTTVIAGIIKSEQLIKQATDRIAEIAQYIRESTKKRYAAEYLRLEELQKSIKISELTIARARSYQTEDAELIIDKNEKNIASAKKQIVDIEERIQELSSASYVSEYSRIRDIQNSINGMKEVIALAQLKLYQSAKENNNSEQAQEYRDSVMRMTSLDLDKYYDISNARKDIQDLMSRESDELVGQMKYVLNTLQELIEDTKPYPEIERMSGDIQALKVNIDALNESSVSLFR